MINWPEIPIYISLFVSLYVLILYFIAFFESDNSDEIKIKKYPKVAIIVPAYNEEENITNTINSLLNLDYPKGKLKIYIVDDGSTDNTLKILEENFKENKLVKILSKENEGKANAVNFALKNIEEDVDLIGLLDADSFVPEHSLKEVIKSFQKDKKVYAVTSAIKIHKTDTLIRKMQNAEYNLSIWLRKVFDNLGSIFIIPGPFSFYKREVFDKLGYFREAHGTEDLEMGMRMQKAGLKIVNNPRAVVYTVSPKTPTQLIKQRLRWVYGFINNSIDYKDLFFNRVRKDNLSFFVLPTSALSLFFAIYIFYYSVHALLKLLFDKLSFFLEHGFELSFNFDLFFINFNLIFYLTIILLVIVFFASRLGDKASGAENMKMSDYISYALLYGFLAPVWISKAVYKTILRQKVKWVKVNK